MTTLRPMRWTDLAMVRRWRNQPRVYEQLLTPRPVTWWEHLRWWWGHCRSADDVMCIIVNDGCPVGTIGWYNSDGVLEAECGRLMIGEARALRQGVAIRAMQALQRAMRSAGPVTLWLTVRATNAAALAVYRRTQWREVDWYDGLIEMRWP